MSGCSSLCVRSMFWKNLLGAGNADFIHELNAKSLRKSNQHCAETEDVASKTQVAMERICTPDDQKAETVSNKKKNLPNIHLCDRMARQARTADTQLRSWGNDNILFANQIVTEIRSRHWSEF